MFVRFLVFGTLAAVGLLGTAFTHTRVKKLSLRRKRITMPHGRAAVVLDDVAREKDGEDIAMTQHQYLDKVT